MNSIEKSLLKLNDLTQEIKSRNSLKKFERKWKWQSLEVGILLNYLNSMFNKRFQKVWTKTSNDTNNQCHDSNDTSLQNV
jgi:hypothetical protein